MQRRYQSRGVINSDFDDFQNNLNMVLASISPNATLEKIVYDSNSVITPNGPRHMYSAIVVVSFQVGYVKDAFE